MIHGGYRMLPKVNGDQRFIFIQTKSNNKRKKRVGKKRNKHTLPIRERAMHILVTGKIKDYTHPKEVDPFWDTLYRQYEHLIYSEIYLRSTIKQYCIDGIDFNSESIAVLLKTLQVITERKLQLITYMSNFMFIMYGSVMKSRFYGWMQYSQKFTSKFNEVSIQLLNKLKFDANKTRCSVYYYQAFWLCGLSIIGDIRKQLTTTCNLEMDMDRGTLNIPIDSKRETKKRIEGENTYTDSIYEELQSMQKIYHNMKIENDADQVQKSTIGIDNGEEKSPEIIFIENDGVLDRQSRAKLIIANLLEQIDLTTDSLYKSTERSLLKIGRFLKNKIKKGVINIKEEDLLFLKEQYLKGEL